MSGKDYLVTWTDIYNSEHVNHVRLLKPTEDHAIHAIPHRGDIFKKLDKIEEAIFQDGKWIAKPDPYAHSKIPVVIGPNIDFLEYSLEFVPNQGELDFETAHEIAVGLLKDRPRTVLYREPEGNWWVGKMDPINKKAQWRRNYDYGEGFYSNLSKYKSVSDFRKKRRVRRKRDLENILNSRPDRYKSK